MPTSGTHITIVEKLAASSPQFQALLGDPTADPSTPEGRKMTFAKLGAVGPDIFYAMADYGRDYQDFENFLIKIGGTFECISELMGKIDRFVSGVESEITFGVIDSIEQTAGLLQGILREWLIGAIVDAGFNLWPVFEARRQQDRARTEWFWADYLHYVRTGQFANRLLQNTRNSNNPDLRAYALGYLTHYITDVVGHPYVNQVVQGPWRVYWQRHHLVENFIDSYVWDRWHVSRPVPAPPSTEEQPLDVVTAIPNPTGTGAPFTFARLNDHISIGISTLADPVDAAVQKVCDEINDGLFSLGIAENTDMPTPDDADFRAWTQLMRDSLLQVYSNTVHPQNLNGDGFPTTDDIAAAYGAMRLFLKLSTEEKIQEPKAPDILGDIGDALDRFLNDLNNAIRNFPPIPLPSFDGSFSLDALWDAIKRALNWLGDFGEWLIRTGLDFIRDLINLGGTILSEPIKFVLFLINKWLFSIYRQLRDTLVLSAYSVPFTEELAINMGGTFNTASLWRSMGNLGPGQYPKEEDPELERAFVLSDYAPFLPPRAVTVEQPPVDFVAPYSARGTPETGIVPTLPDDFIGDVSDPRPDEMFRVNGTEPPAQSPDPRAPNTFASIARNFGSAMANCARGIVLAEEGTFPLPDYNLDGDRGYAWPAWDVDPQPAAGSVLDPLDPANSANLDPGGTTRTAHVNAVATG